MKDVNYLIKNRKLIYADNAATTEIDADSLRAMLQILENDYSNPSQPYRLSGLSKTFLRNARKVIAECINANPEEIYFTSGGTESDNWAICGTILQNVANNHMITDVIEHHAILNTCKFIEKLGCQVSYLPVDKHGKIDPQELEKIIQNNTKLISIMYANNEIGTVQDIKSIVAIAHKHNIICHTDAVQAVGHVNIDVKDLGVDLLSASAHKFNGPKGVGFLYIKSGTNIESLIHGGSQERNMRAGTENVASIMAMAIALNNNIKNLDENIKNVSEIEKVFLDELSQKGIDYILNSSSQNKLTGIVNISFKNTNGEMLLHRLDLKGISISTGSACDSVNNQVSHVIKALNIPADYAEGTIRISFGKNNSIQDAKTIANEIKTILKN